MIEKTHTHIEWLVVALLSASARILETLAMILPLKAIFVLMKPDIIPSLWFESGLDISHLILVIGILVTISLLLGKILHAMAKRRAHALNYGVEDDRAEEMASIEIKITSSMIVLFISIAVIGILNLYALLLALVLFSVSQIQLPVLKKETKYKFFSLLAISKEEARIKFVSQILFLVYFMSLLFLTIQQNTEITISLLLIILIGRRMFGEFSRLCVGLLQKKQAISGVWSTNQE